MQPEKIISFLIFGNNVCYRTINTKNISSVRKPFTNKINYPFAHTITPTESLTVASKAGCEIFLACILNVFEIVYEDITILL